ncbi:MAG: hypothetical protein ABL985_20415 [Casimicrobium sp.]
MSIIEAACREVVFQLLGLVLTISPPAIHPLDLQSRKIQIGDHRRIAPLPMVLSSANSECAGDVAQRQADHARGEHRDQRALHARDQANGQGELVIRYASLDQLDGIITRMKR